MLIGLAIILSLMLLAVTLFDITKFIIPNWLNAAFIALYPVFLFITPEPIEWWWSLATMLCFFAGGLLIFQLNIMGGGDVKLLIALSLWIGWNANALLGFAFLISLSGGVLAIFFFL
jgi:prepilin peptidase CpaA